MSETYYGNSTDLSEFGENQDIIFGNVLNDIYDKYGGDCDDTINDYFSCGY